MIDSHCHLGHIPGGAEDALAAAIAVGVEMVIDIGMGTADSAEVVARAQMSAGRSFASVGVHPNDVQEFTSAPDATIERLRTLASSPLVVGMGETGLDFYRDRETPGDQEASFVAHITLAKQTDTTLVVHCRDAHRRVLDVLDREGAPGRVVMHCFSGDTAHARECADRGFFCSFAGNLTYKRNDDLRDAARVVPAELLLVETDSPYLAPHPHRGKDNGPRFLGLTVAALAQTRGVTDGPGFEALLADNTRRGFALPG